MQPKVLMFQRPEDPVDQQLEARVNADDRAKVAFVEIKNYLRAVHREEVPAELPSSIRDTRLLRPGSAERNWMVTDLPQITDLASPTSPVIA